MVEVSDAFVDAAWKGEPDAVAQLAEIRSDALEEPIRVTDWPDGIVSNGVVYQHFPFSLRWAGASQDNPVGQAQLTVENVDYRIEQACEAALSPPTLDLSIVRVADPDVIEHALRDASLHSVQIEATRLTAVIRPRDFAEEPAVAFNYTPASAPGLF
ncbi:DUF1833 family protein [Brevundimonas faecalis]|uniref:DUF1833 domain-containing protein n=1 Tax=Brevundimonas faecalis TaxID=947378 RepID=A0ABV2RAS4_9CAUL